MRLSPRRRWSPRRTHPAGRAQGVRRAVGRLEPTADTALAILRYSRGRLAPYKRVRRIEFAELPKTISGKIRRIQLREAEDARHSGAAAAAAPTDRQPGEFWEQDFPV